MVMFEEIIFYLSSKHESLMLLQKSNFCSYAFQLWKSEREMGGGGGGGGAPEFLTPVHCIGIAQYEVFEVLKNYYRHHVEFSTEARFDAC